MNTVFKIILALVLMVTPANAGMLFDLADDAIDCGSSIDNPTKLTICAWVFPTSEGEGGNGIIWIKDAAGTTRKDFRFNSTNQLFFRVARATVTMSKNSADNTLPNGAWAHVCIVWDGTLGDAANDITFYINGVEPADGTLANGSGAITDDGTGTEHIGNRAGDTQTWDGQIDEFYLWEDDLNAAEIAHLASSRVRRIGLQIRPSTLRQYIPLDEVPNGNSGDGVTFRNLASPGTSDCTGDNGANNTGFTGAASSRVSYPE